jgi:hypothetical protein
MGYLEFAKKFTYCSFCEVEQTALQTKELLQPGCVRSGGAAENVPTFSATERNRANTGRRRGAGEVFQRPIPRPIRGLRATNFRFCFFSFFLRRRVPLVNPKVSTFPRTLADVVLREKLRGIGLPLPATTGRSPAGSGSYTDLAAVRLRASCGDCGRLSDGGPSP